jgi:pSer/pThr/pTyr-binding forkhead associated (FHA) protein
VSDLTLTLLRLGFLALLWTFVLIGISVMRTDMFGIKPAKEAAAPAATGQPKAAKPAKPSRKAPKTVAVTEGALTGTTLTLGADQITMGRASDNSLVLDDDYVSSRHARLYPYQGDWVVEDLGSTNGTYIGTDKVTEPTVVKAGTRVKVGRTVLELRK